MENKKNKVFPKIKKKIKWFLTDESWKITKKNALWLSAWIMLLSWLEDATAACWICETESHSSWPAHSSSYPNEWYWDWWGDPSCTATHASWLVNGHFSSNINWTVTWYHEWTKNLYSHNSHSSHWNTTVCVSSCCCWCATDIF